MTECSCNDAKQLNEKDFSLLTSHFSRKRAAFTLAEVLITLGIIGIVAAITIPGLITKYEKKVAVDRVKKVYSILQNATTFSIQDNGPVLSWDWSLSAYDFLQKYYFPYLKVIKSCSRHTEDKKPMCVYPSGLVSANGKSIVMSYDAGFTIADGVTFYYASYPWKGIFIFDINGRKKPNRTGRDLFAFRLYGNPAPGKICGYSQDGFNQDAVCSISNGGINYSGGSMGQCNRTAIGGLIGAGSTCTQTLLYYGWEMPDNYPW